MGKLTVFSGVVECPTQMLCVCIGRAKYSVCKMGDHSSEPLIQAFWKTLLAPCECSAGVLDFCTALSE